MNPIAVIAIIVICVAAFIYFRSAGKHLDRMSNNYEDPDAADRKQKYIVDAGSGQPVKRPAFSVS